MGHVSHQKPCAMKHIQAPQNEDPHVAAKVCTSRMMHIASSLNWHSSNLSTLYSSSFSSAGGFDFDFTAAFAKCVLR